MRARQVSIVEVAPRDGLQNERTRLDTAAKVELVACSVAAGLRRIEVAAFVNPSRVPQMADADAVVAALPRHPDVSYIGLVLNRRGLDRAVEAGVDEVNFVVVATDTFSRRNQGMDTAGALAAWNEVAAAARAAGTPASVTIAAAFGCPFEGEVTVGRVTELAARVADAGPDEIALADTIGVGVPSDVTERLGAVLAVAGGIPLRCHFHNTRNTGIANAYAAVEAGVAALDASTGGIGGCPFAPAATGNIPTEDLAWMLGRMGVDTGVSVPAVVNTAAWLGERLGQSVPALLGKAGVFPPEERHR